MSAGWSERLSGLVTWPARHAWMTLALTLVVAALCLYRVNSLNIDMRLESLFDPQAPTTAALHHVTHDFHGTDELLLLVTAPVSEEAPGAAEQETADQLLAFAERFEAVIAADPQASELVRRVSHGAGDSIQRFVEEVIVPAGAFYLDEPQFNELKARLTPGGMAAQIARNEEFVSLPVAATGPLAKMMLKDPLHLYELLAPRLERMRPPIETWRGGEAYLSADARSLLIRIVATRPAGEADFAAALMTAAPRWAAAANPGDLDLAWSGAYAIADHSRTQIRADLIGCIAGSVILMQALFLLVYRRVNSFIVAFTPVALGVLAAFGVFALWREQVTPITAAIGAILAGMGIDYAIHYLSHFTAARARGATAIEASRITGGVLLAMTAACGTSVAAFGAIAISNVPLLRDFAVLGALGLGGAFMASLVVLPALLTLTQRRREESTPARLNLSGAIAWLDRHRGTWRPVAAIGFAALAVVVLAHGEPWLESDPAVMHPQPNPPLAAQERITAAFSGAPESLIIHMHADSSPQLAGLIQTVDRRLRSQDNSDLVMGVLSPAALLPEPDAVHARRAAMEQIDSQRVVEDFRKAVDDSSFSLEAYRDYETFLARMLRPAPPPNLQTLARHSGVSGMLLPIASLGPNAPPPTQALAIAFLSEGFVDRKGRETAINRLHDTLADLPNATATGLSVAGQEMERGVREDLPRILVAAGTMVIIWVLACLRSIRLALLAIVPAIFGAACLLASMRLFGVKLNMVNMVALPILAGTAIDAGIFLTSLSVPYLRGQVTRSLWLEQMAASLQAIALCTATTMLGFGSLMLATTPAVASLGLLLPVGMGAALAGCLFILTPLLLRLQPHHERIAS